MKIAFVQRHLSSENGGEERSLFSLIQNLDNDIDPVLLSNKLGDYSKILSEKGNKVYIVQIQEWSVTSTINFFWSIKRAYFILKKERIDLIHVNSYKDITWSFVLSKLLRIPLSLHLRLNAPEYLSRQYKLAIRRTNLLIANSDFVKRDWENHLNKHINVVWNGLDSDRFTYSPGTFIEPFKILFIGRLVKEKGVELLPDAYRLLTLKYKSNLRIVGSAKHSVDRGEKDYQKWLSTKFESEVAKGNVEVLGHESDPRKHFEWADFIWIPSFHDSFGRTLMEGMIVGCIPIISNVGESKNCEIHDNCKFREGSSSDLARKTEEMIQSDMFAYSKKMHVFAKKHFDIKKTANQCTGLFKGLKKTNSQ